MRRLALTLVPVLIFACDRQPVAPQGRVVPSDRPLFSQTPADGNGRKLVIPVDVQFPAFVTCQSGASLDLHLTGWVQVEEFDRPNLFLVHGIHFVFTFSNAAGETFVWREMGVDVLTIDENGDIIDRLAGRDGFDGVIGHLVVDVTTGDVRFVAGNPVGTSNDQACAALT
jgi:hypothetical protein